jgi:hypothetical protein
LFHFSPSIAGTPLPVAETPATFHFLSVAETPFASNLSSFIHGVETPPVSTF